MKRAIKASIIRNSFLHKNGNRRLPYFVKEHSDSKSKYTVQRRHHQDAGVSSWQHFPPPRHLVSPLVCRGSWMSTVVLYCWCHSDSASVLLYFTFKYLVLGREGPYFVKEHSDSKSKYTVQRRHHQDARVSSWQHVRGLPGKGFPTDNRHSHWHKLCPSPSPHISHWWRIVH